MDFSQDQAAIKKRRRLADMLQGMAGQSPQGQMVGNHYVAPAITQHLAQLLAGYKGRKAGEQADTMEADLGKRRQAYATSLLGNKPGDSFQEKASYFGELQSADPDLANSLAGPLFKGAGSGDNPSAVDEYNFYSKLPPDQQKNYLNMKRSGFGAGGVQYTAGGDQIVGTNKIAADKAAITTADETAKDQVKATTEAKQAVGPMQDMENQLVRIMGDPLFAEAVGPTDAITGRIGETFGSKAGVLGAEVERVSNKLVTEAVSKWKGAISDKELNFFQKSVPQRSSSPETWASWYQNEFLPMKARAEQAAGIIQGGGIKFLGFEQ